MGSGIKQGLEGIVRENVFVLNAAYDLLFKKNNAKIKAIVDECAQIDPISDFDRFKDFIIHWKRSEDFHTAKKEFRCVGGESRYYGHVRMLYEYAQSTAPGANDTFDKRTAETKEYLVLPKIEHGVSWYEDPPPNFPAQKGMNYVYQGEYRKKLIHEAYPFLPVYCIGPYIHYAVPIYTAETIEALKQKFGKTLLVFPFHCHELNNGAYDTMRFVDDVMNKYAKDFDTVMVSVYWNDVADTVYEMFQKSGAKLVSCGFRGDDMFIRRLKTILALADVTLGNDLGTHIGYSIHMQRPHILIEGNNATITQSQKKSAQMERTYQKNLEACRVEYSFANYLDGVSYQNGAIYKKFWGGGQTRSPEEIRDMIEISSDLLRMTKGFFSRMPRETQRAIEFYRHYAMLQKYELLKGSIDSCALSV